ncbi:MAG: hypothetical protein ACI379_07525 [Nocardioides sp.]|uniref:hypothetical protein n=1 Tax=Nocardioides sp. TaxID=35761 RepID=UPI003F04EAE1
MTEATWAALTVTLTLIGLGWTWLAFRRRGAANALRALGFALLPAAAWLTGTMQMFVEIAASVTGWAGDLVLDPRSWTGIGLAGAAVASWAVSGFLRDRQLGRARTIDRPAGHALGAPAGQGDSTPQARRSRNGPPTASGGAAADDDMAEIEALLKKRGIQ